MSIFLNIKKLFFALIIGLFFGVLINYLPTNFSAEADLKSFELLMPDGSTFAISKEEVVKILQSNSFLEKVERRSKIQGLKRQLAPRQHGGKGMLEVSISRQAGLISLTANARSHHEAALVLNSILSELNDEQRTFFEENSTQIENMLAQYTNQIDSNKLFIEKSNPKFSESSKQLLDDFSLVARLNFASELNYKLTKLKAVKYRNNRLGKYIYVSGVNEVDKDLFIVTIKFVVGILLGFFFIFFSTFVELFRRNM